MPIGLVARARELRWIKADAERILWRTLRAHRCGHRFRRRAPLGRFMLTTFASKVVSWSRLMTRSSTGNRAMPCGARSCTSRGPVLRFWNHDVRTNLDGVRGVILAELERHPHPDFLPQAGERVYRVAGPQARAGS